MMIVLAASLGCAVPGLGRAALGESEASVGRDAAHLAGVVKIMSRPAYRIHEIDAPSGTVLREYLGADGKVFAVAWQGMAPPNLRDALGSYFEPLASATRAGRGAHHHLSMSQGDLVVEATGHARAFMGRAYLMSAIPGGVALAEIR